MILVIEIAAGIVLGVFLLGAIAHMGERFSDWRDWKARNRALTRRFDEATRTGFKYDDDSIYTLEEQLFAWEKAQAKRIAE
jgi:hypothetical protein